MKHQSLILGKNKKKYFKMLSAVIFTQHWGVKLILAYSWAKPAILVAGKSRGDCFYYAPPFLMGRHKVSPLSIRPSRQSVLSVPYVTQMVSVLLKRLVYWIQILYTGI